jgi:hypothetical protein
MRLHMALWLTIALALPAYAIVMRWLLPHLGVPT